MMSEFFTDVKRNYSCFVCGSSINLDNDKWFVTSPYWYYYHTSCANSAELNKKGVKR